MAKCKKCGKCCRWLLIGLRLIADVDAEFIESRGLKVVMVGDGGVALYTTGPPCKHLKDDNTCSIYENRPKSCKEYPQNRLVVLPDCGYNNGS